jgi:hypothetical protein
MLMPGSLLMRSALICAAVVPFALLSGCAMTSSGPADSMISQVSGSVHGGQSPIQGATVNLYVTTTAATGYGQAATLVGTSGTDVNGVFTISPSATTTNCPAGQQAYITSASGYPSGSSALTNNSTLLMAALGNCSNISATTSVIINEVTTVAAAYALSGFTTTSANGSLFQANVSAPAANRGAIGTASVAAGLPHAFLNAASLANYALGTANSATANITVGASTVNGSVPAAEINTLGNILQSCVNGVTGNSSCVSLFSFTPSISGVAPTNTLQAMINLARNPYPSAAAMNATTGLFSLASASPAFQPSLTAEPPDWSLAIVYKNTTVFGASNYFIGMDPNDTVYAGSAATSAKIAGLSAYGAATPAFAAAASGTSTRQIAPDALGNIWVANNGTLLVQYSATTGTIINTYTYTGGDVYGVAVDKANNVWVGNSVGTTNVTELAYPGYTTNYTSTVAGTFQPVAVFIDANQNIWTADYFTNGTLASVLPNLTPASTASYTTTGTVVTPVTNTFASSAVRPIGVVVDASGNAWYGIVGTCPTSCGTSTPADDNTTGATGVEEVTPGLTSSVITTLSPQSEVANATLGAEATGIPSIDGAGTLYLSDNIGAGALGIHVYSTLSGTTGSLTGGQVLSPPSGYLGCYLATPATTTCGAGSSSAVYNSRETAVDSTGSVWADISTTGGLTQLIGLGAPSWPLLQTGKPGLSPGNSAVTPLP